MIENEHQYHISQKKLAALTAEIEEVTASSHHPLRNKLLLASLTHVKQEIEEEILLYQFTHRQP
jgi:hypothetical protein